MAAETCLEVVGVVVDQIDLLVARSEKGSHAPFGVADVVGKIHDAPKFVAVDVHGIETTRVGGVDVRAINGAVVRGFPIVS